MKICKKPCVKDAEDGVAVPKQCSAKAQNP